MNNEYWIVSLFVSVLMFKPHLEYNCLYWTEHEFRVSVRVLCVLCAVCTHLPFFTERRHKCSHNYTCQSTRICTNAFMCVCVCMCVLLTRFLCTHTHARLSHASNYHIGFHYNTTNLVREFRATGTPSLEEQSLSAFWILYSCMHSSASGKLFNDLLHFVAATAAAVAAAVRPTKLIGPAA